MRLWDEPLLRVTWPDTQAVSLPVSLCPIFCPPLLITAEILFGEHISVHKVPRQYLLVIMTLLDAAFDGAWNLRRERQRPGDGQAPLTATCTDCMARSHGGFRARGRVAYQKVVSAANAPKPMSVLVGSVRTYCRKSTISGIRKYWDSSWACIVLGWWHTTPISAGEKNVTFIPGRRDAAPDSRGRPSARRWLTNRGH